MSRLVDVQQPGDVIYTLNNEGRLRGYRVIDDGQLRELSEEQVAEMLNDDD